jgi:hypothetical protein
VYFDAINWEWEYEPEGYDLGEAGWYLPDFFLPYLDSWAEVKPRSFTESERRKAFALCCATEQTVILLVGTPDVVAYEAMTYMDPFEVAGETVHATGNLEIFLGHEGNGSSVMRAVTAARSARFEFGEVGR